MIILYWNTPQNNKDAVIVALALTGSTCVQVR